MPLARSQHENPTAFIENTEVFGDLASQPRFVEAYLWALDSLHRDGARATLETSCLRKGSDAMTAPGTPQRALVIGEALIDIVERERNRITRRACRR